MTRVLLSWSSGKDSAWSLYVLRRTPGIEVVGLLTTFNCTVDRVAMHAVRRTLVEAQAARIGLPLWRVDLPWPCSNDIYEDLMGAIWRKAVAEQIAQVAFGDLFLRDVREYRERQLRSTGLAPLFPLWNLPTRALAEEMVGAGVKAKITCVDPAQLDRSFAGREFDKSLLAALPPGLDPCGENGEFHTFVYDAPAFSRPISVRVGEIVERDNFVFADVLLSAPRSGAGLCASCANAQEVVSDRGSVFLRCGLSDGNAGFARYPRLPVLTCSGWMAEPMK